MIKMVSDMGVAFRFLYEQSVQQGARNRINALRVVEHAPCLWQAVRLASERSVCGMHGSVSNGQGNFSDRISDAGFFQGPPTPIAQCQIDAASTFVLSDSRVGSALVHVHVVTSFSEHQRP